MLNIIEASPLFRNIPSTEIMTTVPIIKESDLERKSPFEGVRLRSKLDIQALEATILSAPKERVALLQKIKDRADDSGFVYDKYHFPVGNTAIHRLYNESSLQAVSKDDRRRIVAKATFEIDAKTSGPNIVAHVADYHGISCQLLKQYAADRAPILHAFAAAPDVQKYVPKLIHCLCQRGGYKTWAEKHNCDLEEPDMMGELNQEIYDIIEELVPIYADLMPDETEENREGKMMSRIIFYFEHKITISAFQFCQKKGIITGNEFTPIFDGFLAYDVINAEIAAYLKSEKCALELIEHVHKETGMQQCINFNKSLDNFSLYITNRHALRVENYRIESRI